MASTNLGCHLTFILQIYRRRVRDGAQSLDGLGAHAAGLDRARRRAVLAATQLSVSPPAGRAMRRRRNPALPRSRSCPGNKGRELPGFLTPVRIPGRAAPAHANFWDAWPRVQADWLDPSPE